MVYPELRLDKLPMHINRDKDGMGIQVQKGWSDAGLTKGYIHAEPLPKNDTNANSIVISPEQLALMPLYLVIGKDYPNAKQCLADIYLCFHSITK